MDDNRPRRFRTLARLRMAQSIPRSRFNVRVLDREAVQIRKNGDVATANDAT